MALSNPRFHLATGKVSVDLGISEKGASSAKTRSRIIRHDYEPRKLVTSTATMADNNEFGPLSISSETARQRSSTTSSLTAQKRKSKVADGRRSRESNAPAAPGLRRSRSQRSHGSKFSELQATATEPGRISDFGSIGLLHYRRFRSVRILRHRKIRSIGVLANTRDASNQALRDARITISEVCNSMDFEVAATGQ